MRKLWISLVILILSTFVLSACGGAPATTAPVAPATSAPAAQPTKAAAGMSHDANPMSDNSYDVHFIDSTLDHHVGVIQMAQQALKESNTVAIKDLAPIRFS